MKLVDSSFLIDFAKGDEDAEAYLEAHDDDEELGASTIVLSEMYRGLFIVSDMGHEEVLSHYSWLEAIPFDNRVALEAADIYVQLREDGNMINKSDIYIAATARLHGFSLVVGDDHFEAINDLDIGTYQ